MKNKSLVKIFEKIGHFGLDDIGCNDKNGSHSYLPVYDNLFERYRDNCVVMEIGLALGNSITLWDKYFKNSTIIGVDISIVFDEKAILDDNSTNNIIIVQADATKPDFLKSIEGFAFDIIIDDGSHMENDQIAAFELLKGKMKQGGLYIIEDILSLETNRERFKSLHPDCEIFDLRGIKGRFDDVLIVYSNF